LRYQRQTVLEMAKPADEGTLSPAPSAVSAHAPAKPALKTTPKAIAHSHSAIQRGKISPNRKPVKKPNANQKPLHKAAAHKAPTHRDTKA
jgi:hypothetical protein